MAALPLSGARGASFWFATLALLLFVSASVRPDSMQSVRGAALDVFSPVLAVVNWPVQQAAAYVRTITGLGSLQEENARLKEENLRLRQWYQTALQLKAENESLQKLMNIQLDPARHFVTARVVADSGNAYVKSLLVMAGRDQGIGKGQAVLAGDGLIGRVVESGHRASRVLLMTDVNSRIPVVIEGSNDHGILAGNNTDTPGLDFLPLGAAPADGARVITSGSGGVFPYGLPVGRVVKEGEGRYLVQPFAGADRVTYVRVVDRVEDPNLHLSPPPKTAE